MKIVPADRLEKLLEVGIALSSTRELDQLLEMIVQEGRRFTHADAGTLYLAEGQQLRAVVAQCQTFVDRWGESRAKSLFRSFTIPINMDSIAGAAAFTLKVVNISDVQDPKAASPYHYNPEFDREHDYSTHSNLAVPMTDRDGNLVGVLQLLNAEENGVICPFGATHVRLAQALASQAGVAIRNTQLTESLLAAHLSTLHRLGIAAEWRDKETAKHITRVAQYSKLLAVRRGWPEEEIRLLVHAAPMHDVGKLGIPDAILHKPGALDDHERTIMQTHTIIGARIMEHADNPIMKMAQVVALNHHERWDGNGYPRRIKGDQIPEVARIVALADVYDALSSARCYKPAFSEEKVHSILESEKGTHFEPEMIDLFFSNFDEVREIRDRYADTPEELAGMNVYETLSLDDFEGI